MKIRRLKVKNYRQFYGEQEIFFSTDPSKPITLILGDMGYGKSNIMNAICWALWGDEPHLSLHSKSHLEYAEEFPNTAALEELSLGDEIQIEVEVCFEDAQGNECIILRRASASLDERGAVQKEVRAAEMFYDIAGTHAPIDEEDVESQIAQIIPRPLRHLFLFNGETIHQDVLEARNLTSAVDHISQISVVDRASKHIQGLMLRERPNTADEEELIQVQKEASDTSDLLSEINNELGGIESKLSQLEAEFNEQQDILGGFNVDEIQELQKKQKEERSRKGQLTAEVKQSRQRLHKEIVLTGGVHIADGVADECLKFIEKQRVDGVLPPPIDKSYLERLIEASACICGASLNKGSENRKRVEEVLHEYDLPEYKNELDKVEPILRQHFSGDAKANIFSLMEEFEHSKRAVETNRRELERLESELKKYPEERVRHVGIEMQRIRNEERQHGRDHDKLVRKRDELINKLSGLEKKQQHIDRKMGRANRARNRLYYYELVGSYLKEVRKRYMSQVRKSLAETLRKNWGSLILKDERHEIQIDDAYHPQVLDANGRNRTPTRSKGELQTLGYAFTSALTTVARIRAPFIVDTPLGRISKSPGANIARQLPDILPDRQLIFLATDREYDSSTKQAWASLIGASYKLTHDEGITKVEEYAS